MSDTPQTSSAPDPAPAAAPSGDDGGTAAQAPEQQAAQTPSPAPQTTPATPAPQEQASESASGEQDFVEGILEPYLNDLSAMERAVAEPVLRRFREEQDKRVNERFQQEAEKRKAYEQYGDPSHIANATKVYNAFINDPVNTTEWLMERAQDDLGVDVRAQLKQQLQDVAEEAAADPTVDESKPLTEQDIERLLEQREQKRLQEQQQAQQTQVQREVAVQRTQSWLDEATSKHSVEVPENLKSSVLYRAMQLKETGEVAESPAAIERAVQEFAEAMGARTPNTPSDPIVAQGGTPPPPPGFDVTDREQRLAAMENRLNAAAGA